MAIAPISDAVGWVECGETRHAMRKLVGLASLHPSYGEILRGDFPGARLAKAGGGPYLLLNPPSEARCAMKLKDPKLFRQQCYVDGEWVDADTAAPSPVHQPGDRRDARHGAAHGRRRDAARDRGRRTRRCPPGAPRPRKERAADPAQMVRPDDGEPGRSGDADDGRAGQAAGRVEGRDRLRRLVHRVVRRGGASASMATPFPAHQRDKRIVVHQAADRRVRRDHAVEFSRRR